MGVSHTAVVTTRLPEATYNWLMEYRNTDNIVPFRQRKPEGSSAWRLLSGGRPVLLGALFVGLAVGTGGNLFSDRAADVSGIEQETNTFAYYPNCSAARSAGAAPLRLGDPGYRSELDRDGDGVACEPYRGW